jgi:hypothetical protein
VCVCSRYICENGFEELEGEVEECAGCWSGFGSGVRCCGRIVPDTIGQA